MLQLAGKWPCWSKHPLVGLSVSVTLSIHLTQMKYLKGASVLNPHCSTTWEKSLSLVPVKHAPKPFSTTVEPSSTTEALPHLAWALALPGLSQLGPTQHGCIQGGRWAAN